MKDIVEILRYAPKGTILYSPLCGKVELVKVTPNIDDKFGKIDGSITIRTIKDPHPSEHTFDRYGRYMISDNVASEECMLFPQILHRTWNDWQRILIPKAVGCVVVDSTSKKSYFVPKAKHLVDATGKGAGVFPHGFDCMYYASPDETEAFLDKLDRNHLKWCKSTGEIVADVKGYVEEAERKACAVECLPQHKYNRGDKIVCTAKGKNKWLDTIQEVDTASRVYKLESGFIVPFDTLDDEDGNCPAELDSRKPFTEFDLQPFCEVLVRKDRQGRWQARHYSHLGCTELGYPKYVCTDGEQYEQCVPYNDETKRLFRTTDNYAGRYKTWEDDVEY